MPRSQPDVPYVGLRPFERHEADRFFGRAKDSQRLCDQILSGRLTILYAQSGLGKSSLLRALAIPQLESNEAHVDYFDSWAHEDPFAVLRERVIELAAGAGVPDPGRGSPTLLELVRLVNKVAGRSVILILDQFEEFLVHHGQEIDPLRAELAALIRSPKVDATVVLALREEFLAALEPFRQHIPDLFLGAYRLEPLSEPDLRDAICRPADVCGGFCEPGMAELLIRDLREKHSGAAGAGPPPIELPMLQLVCQQLWKDAGGGRLSRELYERLGGAQPILDRYVRELMPRGFKAQVLTAQLLVYLAPPSGLKISYTAGDLSRIAALQRDVAEAELARLSDARILRTRQHSAGVRYELQHDAFIHVLSSWRDRVLKHRRWKRLVWNAISVVGLVVLVYVGDRLLYLEPRDRKDLRFQAAISAGDPLVSALALAKLGDSRNSDQYVADLQRVATAPIPAAVLREAGSEPPKAVVSAWFTPDGKQAGTASSDGVFRLRSADGRAKPKEVRTPGELSMVVVSSDDQWIAAATKNEVRLIGSDGSPSISVRSPSGDISALGLSVNGGIVHRIAAAYENPPPARRNRPDFRIRVWNGSGTTLTDIATKHEGQITAVCFNASGNRLLTASLDGTAKVWDLDRPGTPPVTLGGEKWHGRKQESSSLPEIYSAAFSPDGGWVLCGLDDGRVIVLDSDGHGDHVDLIGHTEPVIHVSFSADGQRIVTGSRDRTARIWDLRTEFINTAPPGAAPKFESRVISAPSVLLRGHTGAVTSARFSPDGSRIITASEDGTARIWWSESQEPRILAKHNRPVESIAFSPDGRLVASAGRDHLVHVWDVIKQAEIATLRGHSDWVHSVAFSPDGRTLATASSDHTIRLWDAASGHERGVRTLETGVLSVAFTPDGTGVIAATRGSPASVAIWPVIGSGSDPLLRLHEAPNAINSAAISKDGARFAAGLNDGQVLLWQREGQAWAVGRPPARIFEGASVFSVLFSPDGGRIAASSADWQTRLLDLSGKVIRQFQHRGEVRQIGFSSDRKLLVTASTEGTATIWDISTGLLRMTLSHSAGVRGAAFRPGTPELVTGSDDGVVRLWRIGGNELLNYLQNASTACLAPLDRVQFLGDSENSAERGYNNCEAGYGR